MTFKQYLILHSEQDGASRYFVAGQYDPGKYDVIEWYTEPEKRADYEAQGLPQPSAFPTVVDTVNKTSVTLPDSMKAAIATLTGQPTLEDQVSSLQAQVELLSQVIQEMITNGGA